jgi:hypothetical protein
LDVPTPFNGEHNYEQLKIDGSSRVWVAKQIDVRVFQAPLSASSTPMTTLASVAVLGGGTINFSNASNDVHGIVPSTDGQYLWISQPALSRVLRVRSPLGSSPVVDVILGQTSLSGTSCNQGNSSSSLTTLCNPGALSLDRNGNLFVSDHYLEDEGNQRLLMFAASTFPPSPTSVLYAPAATKEFPASNSFGKAMATFEPAFDSTNRMVVGFNPYTDLRFVQYYNNPTALLNGKASDPSYAVPSGQLQDFYSWPVAASFDSADNLYVYDANRGRVSFYATPFVTSTATQINAGGPAVAPFVADMDFSGGSTINHANTIDLTGVTNPAPMAVYQTARTGNFTYTIPAAAGSSHNVRLHFAETYFSSAGSRVFNVSINGTQVLSRFDIYATAGAKNKAVIEQFTEKANSAGQYVIQFTSVVNNSLVSGIQVE